MQKITLLNYTHYNSSCNFPFKEQHCSLYNIAQKNIIYIITKEPSAHNVIAKFFKKML